MIAVPRFTCGTINSRQFAKVPHPNRPSFDGMLHVSPCNAAAPAFKVPQPFLGPVFPNFNSSQCTCTPSARGNAKTESAPPPFFELTLSELTLPLQRRSCDLPQQENEFQTTRFQGRALTCLPLLQDRLHPTPFGAENDPAAPFAPSKEITDCGSGVPQAKTSSHAGERAAVPAAWVSQLRGWTAFVPVTGARGCVSTMSLR